MFLQIPFDFTHPVTLDIEVEDFTNDLGLLWHYLKNAIRSFGAATELRVVQHSFSAPHSVADAKLDVLAAEMAFGLIQCRELVDHTVTDIQSVHSSYFNVNPNVHSFELSDLPDRFQCIPTKTAERLHQNQVYLSFSAVSHELLVTRAVGSANAGCNVRIYCNGLSIGIAFDKICVVGNLRFQIVVPFLMAGTDPTVCRDPEPPDFDGDISLCLRNLNHFSGHSKTSMTVLEFSISWKVCNRKATF